MSFPTELGSPSRYYVVALLNRLRENRLNLDEIPFSERWWEIINALDYIEQTPEKDLLQEFPEAYPDE